MTMINQAFFCLFALPGIRPDMIECTPMGKYILLCPLVSPPSTPKKQKQHTCGAMVHHTAKVRMVRISALSIALTAINVSVLPVYIE